jgi:glycosyltransferase involved in cell wall biosynthesis
MTIGIDLRCLPADGTPGAGVAHAARFLTEALVIRDVPWTWKLFVPRGAQSVGNAGGERCVSVELPNDTGSALRAALRRSRCGLLFVPSGSVAPALPVRSIPWIHDLAIFHHPEWFPQSFLRRTLTTSLFARGIRSAPIVFAVSEDTKAELVSRFHPDPSRVIVTYEGGDPFLHALHGEDLRVQKQMAKRRVAATGVTNAFVLALGTVEPRKNLAMLIQAWRRAARSTNRPVDLVIAGRDGWKLKEIHAAMECQVIPERDGSRLHRIYAMDEDARRDLLLAADLVAVPSHHEGFGLVALESMQAETAVLASAAGALPEVVADAGILLDPNDRDAWSRAIQGLIHDDISRIDMSLAGKSRSERFTWEAVAMKVEEGMRGLG